MDEFLRRLERRAKGGDYQDRAYWMAALERAGLPDPDLEEISAPLTHFEAIQQDFDDIWWHSTKRFRFGWDFEPVKGLVKAHHSWGHRRGHHGENSKRKTLRTHRDGSKRCYRNKHDKVETEALSGAAEEAARRRKKRFGGRNHKQWFHNGEFGPWIFEVDLDE
jgi:hypothetical protein